MNAYLILFLFLYLKVYASENCLRFCNIRLSTLYYTFHNNLRNLNTHFCSHLILDAHQKDDNQINPNLLLKAFESIRLSNPNQKVLTLVQYNELILNESIPLHLLEIFNKMDGFYFNFREDNYICADFHKLKTIWEKQRLLSNILTTFRQKFSKKIIVTTVGPKYAYHGFYNFQIFNKIVDYIALDTEQRMMDIHIQNYFPSKQMIGNNATMANLTNTLINNGIDKRKLLIYADGPRYLEPRIRVIWSSLNKFPGILIDNLQNLNNKEYGASKMNDDISKLEKLHVCSSPGVTKTNKHNLYCYYSVKDAISYNKISKEKYEKCDRIMFSQLTSNYNNNVSDEKLQKVIEYFHNLDLINVTFILSIDIDFENIRRYFTDVKTFQTFSDVTALNLIGFVKKYDLNGIELVCEDLMDADNLNKLITKIKSKMSKSMEIGLQVNVFKAEKFVEILNNVSWVTHKINPLSDAGLAIFYQWNNLHEKCNLNLQKVVIKISPAIWQQKAIFSFPGKTDTNEDENPEDDLILNRKYLCMNETITQNLPKSNALNNLPIVFSIPDHVEESKDKMLKRVKDPQLIMAVLSFYGFRKPLPKDAFYLRYETKEIIQYKTKVAEKYGFGGGFAISSINDDDVDEICGTSLFNHLVENIK